LNVKAIDKLAVVVTGLEMVNKYRLGKNERKMGSMKGEGGLIN
jgi:hypothetical protein